jgi:protein arginine kinase activator
MSMGKCDHCNKAATVLVTEIKGGKRVEKHLCENCAAANEGLPVKAQPPINELLTNFVMAHSGLAREKGATCEDCGIAWAEFRQTGLLGCEHDYTLFEKELVPLLQRAHEGATHHIGKEPARGGGGGAPMKRQAELAKLRKELAKAVEAEDYERAAKLRDQIRQGETSGETGDEAAGGAAGKPAGGPA